MNRGPIRKTPSHAQLLAGRAIASVERFLHIEAVSGIALLIAAVVAFIWANSPVADSYHAFWHVPLSLGLGSHTFSHSLHFWVNDVLMAIFFLVVGMEIRREIHEGALANLRQATLPLAAALGGVVVPAAIYLCLNGAPEQRVGWAVPTATDIAFAVGLLALLGRSIPGSVRIFLLALAIIDDIIAILLIAVFYSEGLEYAGLVPAGFAILMVLGLQWVGVGSVFAYIFPGILLWVSLYQIGLHPTLAGVILGLLTPVIPRLSQESPLDAAGRALRELAACTSSHHQDAHHMAKSIKTLHEANREMLPPVTRVQLAFHPWVAYGIMPLFALANAGVSVRGLDLELAGSKGVMFGVFVALTLGKPLGVVSFSWLMVRLGWCRLPSGMTWSSLLLVGMLAGIGFTMSIFIATLAFDNETLLGAAKLGVLLASVLSGIAGLCWGAFFIRRSLRPAL
jgi:NhaA family Na+:H+ antiporter